MMSSAEHAARMAAEREAESAEPEPPGTPWAITVAELAAQVYPLSGFAWSCPVHGCSRVSDVTHLTKSDARRALLDHIIEQHLAS